MVAAVLWSVDRTNTAAAVPAVAAPAVGSDAGAVSLDAPAGGPLGAQRPGGPNARAGGRAEVPAPGAAPASGERGDTVAMATLGVAVRSAETGAAVTGVRVHCSVGNGLLFSDSTDSSGRAEFRVPAVGVLVSLSVPEVRGVHGAAHKILPALEPAESRDVVLEVPTDLESPFRGRVVAEEDGQPIPGARVAIRETTHWTADSAADYAGRVLGSVSADAGGGFTIGFPTWGERVHAVVEAPGRACRIVKVERVPESAPPIEIPMERAAALLVTALSRAGEPLSGIGIRAIALRGSVRQDVIVGDLAWSGEADAAGEVRLDGLVPDTRLFLEVRSSQGRFRRRPETFSLAPGEERPVTIAVGDGATVHGRVVSGEDSRVGYARVSMRPAWSEGSHPPPGEVTAWTDSRGRFRFDDVEDGTWSLSLAPGRYASEVEDVRVMGGVADRDVVLRAHRELGVSGRVVGLDGEGVEGAVVTGTVDGGRSVRATSESGGRFELRPLAPGRVRLRANLDGFAPSETAEPRAGADDVVLRLRRGGELFGTVLDAGGELVPAWVSAVPSGGVEDVELASGGSEVGRFHFGGLAPGSYDLLARTVDGRFAVRPAVPVAAGSVSEIPLEVGPGARLRVRNGGDAFVSFRVLASGVAVARGQVGPGESRLEPVPAGEISVAFDHGETHRLELAPGEKRELVWKGTNR